jgi:hypothetical protein
MPYVKTYKLFISHAWAADEDYNRLIELLNDVQTIKVKICSETQHDPAISDPESVTGLQKLKWHMSDQVRSSNCALIFPGLFVTNNFWTKHMIYFCQMYGVIPLSMALPDGEELHPELAIKTKAVVDWNVASLEAAIKEYSTTRLGAT